ncbi:unnamed protein product [Cylicocyclus nassatus]|uniref:Amidase domain-containing protein n=1 Tax=Cylicocyclus nassatus TaxID=53992 RepID=A0AA36DTM5_CYLNA|nr:unnamed protein product [Cylicocyclus nassatus]
MDYLETMIYHLSRIYFLIMNLIFDLVNFFNTKRVVPPTHDGLLMISATEAVRKISKREITSRELVQAYVHRIGQVNHILNAVVVRIFDEALKKAVEVDKEIADMDDERLAQHIKSKPLLGVPFTVKDTVKVEGQIITCGVYSQRDKRCTRSAEVIKRMEAAGAILIAITNVPEVASWVESSNGIYGRTNNPYDSRRIAGGSSGGKGALISAAGSVASRKINSIGIGSDIAGSIRIPSFMSGVFGIKPTPGVVPLDGHVPAVKEHTFHEQMLCIGPICRYAEDLPLMMKVMGAESAKNLRLRDEVDFKKIRVYYMEGINSAKMETLSSEMREALLEVVSYFEKKFDLEAIRIDLPIATMAIEMISSSIKVEDHPTLAQALLSLNGDQGSLNWMTELPKLLIGKSVHTPGSLLMTFFESMDNGTEQQRIEFRQLRDRMTRQLTELLGDNGILLFPSWPRTAPYHNQPVFAPFDLAYTGLYNALALPAITCPLGLDSEGLPLGVQVNGIINAVVVRLDDEAVKKAAEVDREIGGMDDGQLAEHIKSKPLLGIPFTMKDSMMVEGQVITSGIYLHRENRCVRTAEVIKRMEAAGAILMAITNVPEACYWIESNNAIYGRTRNPYDSRRTSGGSSGGEGALISAAGSVIGVGSDHAGSIRVPSFFNGIFGIKTTPGIIPNDGHIPLLRDFQAKMQCIGPMCRYAEDLPVMMEVMTGEKAKDLHLRNEVDFKNIRIFYMEGIHSPKMETLSSEMKDALHKAVSFFEQKFDLQANQVDLPIAKAAVEILFRSLQVKNVPTLSEQLVSLNGDKGSVNWMKEVPKLLLGRSTHTPAGVFMSFFESMDHSTEETKEKYRQMRDRLIKELTDLLGDNGILLFPSWPRTAPFHNQPIFTLDVGYTGLFNALTVPAASCPLGLDSNGLPLGVQEMNYSETIIYLLSRIYFLIMNLIFDTINFFKTKQTVPAPSDDLLMMSATEAVRKISRREVNGIINAVVVRLFDEAIKKAAKIDKEIAEMDDAQLTEHIQSKPLLGIPFTVKDAVEVEGQIITCGVYLHKENRASKTAEVIKRMEGAGAILIAITNVPEACFWVESSNGIYGQSKNPYDSRRATGGSSGGEGALISAAGSVIGIGSDIGGSIRIPSFMNGIFGIKATPGIIPLDGHVPMVKDFQEQMLCIGPMCRYAEDLPLMMEVMGGENARKLNIRDKVDFKNVRIFYMEGIHSPKMETLNSEMRKALLKAVSYMEQTFDLEAIRIDLPIATMVIEMLFTSLQAEGPTLSEQLISLDGDKGSLNWRTEVPKLLCGKSVHTPGACFMSFFESIDRTTEEEKAEYRRLRERMTRQLTELLGHDGILLFPTWPRTAPYHNQPVFAPFDLGYTGLFNALTLPAVACPLGLDSHGLPLGVQVVGSHNSDRLLIAAAQQLSKAFGGWTPAWTS